MFQNENCSGYKIPQNFRMKITYSHSKDTGYSVQLKLEHLVYTDTGTIASFNQFKSYMIFHILGSYVCRFNDSQDARTEENNDHIYIFVFDSIHLLTQSGFDFQQSVAYKSAEIPCRYYSSVSRVVLMAKNFLACIKNVHSA